MSTDKYNINTGYVIVAHLITVAYIILSAKHTTSHSPISDQWVNTAAIVNTVITS